YQAFLSDIAAPRGDKAARLELEKPSPDLNVAAAGFAQGRNDPADIQILITTFRLFRHVSYIDQAIAIWTEGDARIDALVALGDRLHALISSGGAGPAQIEPLVAQVGDINAQLTVLENRFSATLSDGARWIRDVLFVVASLATALLLVISGAALASFLRRVRRSEARYRQLVAELRESQDRLSFALDAGRMGTWDWEIATGAVHWSENLERIVGVPVGSFGGTLDAYVELVDPDDRPRMREAFQRAVASDGDYMVEVRMGPPGHQATLIAAQGRVVRDAAGTPIRLVGVALDVTARRELEDQLRHAQKMESIGRLAGGIAHDFNNLLTAITGHGELLAQSLDPADERQADVSAINAAAARAATLTRQLLAYGRQSLLHPEPVNLNEVIIGFEPMLRRLIGEDIRLRTDLAPDLGWVRADAGQLDQVILNLVVNARDAMPTGGTIVLATENADLDEAYVVEHPKAHIGPHVSVAVRDNGVGIDPETIGRIFEPYFTTKERGRGTGLGLATVLGIVEQSGGHIDVTSDPGH
ncbi:MAG TPA: ATP-binding protein, partial [Candidatus Limnocylindrales bacterium]